MFRSRKLLDLARGESCVNCGAEDGTIVAAHSNLPEHGKGQSLKSHDCYVAFLCVKCHAWLDQGRGMDPTDVYSCTRRDKAMMFTRCMDKTTLRLWQRKKIRCA